ncbi:MAG: hypothetical protein VKJ44_10505 [Synechococcus sp.]|nr:hypothetical protein [Synechococcus sp.]
MGLGAEAEAVVADLVAHTRAVIATVQQEVPSGFPEPWTDAIVISA